MCALQIELTMSGAKDYPLLGAHGILRIVNVLFESLR